MVAMLPTLSRLQTPVAAKIELDDDDDDDDYNDSSSLVYKPALELHWLIHDCSQSLLAVYTMSMCFHLTCFFLWS